jgi:cytoskeletal protein CcmA (bactofilin family)
VDVLTHHDYSEPAMKQLKNSQNLIHFPHHKRNSTKDATDTLSVIAAGMQLEGNVQSSGVVKVSGIVLGNVSADNQVLVAKGGRVDGDVHTREAVLDGEVMGSIIAEERVEIQASAVIRGDIVTPRLMVHEGAVLNVEVARPTTSAVQRGVA